MTADLRRASPASDYRKFILNIPACLTVGLAEGEPGGLPGCCMDGRLPAVCMADGRLSRGAALILADQALARGVYALLPEMPAMMTLDLRLDWHGALPAATEVAFGTTRAVREGALCFVEGVMTADGREVASGSARFLVGAMPGGRTTDRPMDPLGLQPSTAADFDALMALQADGDGWLLAPEPALVGARAVPAYHGGFVAATLDAASTRLAEGHRAVDFEIRYLRPARANLPMRVAARPVRAGRMASVLEADARQGETLVATARALFSGVPTEEGQVCRFG
jgi:acyl-coenzyme A thioesterase PaaI-like protein